VKEENWRWISSPRSTWKITIIWQRCTVFCRCLSAVNDHTLFVCLCWQLQCVVMTAWTTLLFYRWCLCLHTHTQTRLTPLFPGLPRWAGTRSVKPIWTLLEQETVSGSGISWAICKSAPHSRQTTTPATHYSVFNRPDALSAAQLTASKHCLCLSVSDVCVYVW